MDDMTKTIDEIFGYLDGAAKRDYGDERVTQLAHAIQCGWLAEKAGASSALVTAALLHDIGHMVNPEDRAATGRGEDGFHEVVGCDYLSKWYGPDVTEPIMWHVAAKRYLTATEPAYFSTLSAGSVRSLELQGGPFSEERASQFIDRPYAEDAVQLRRWDDDAKVVGLETPPLEHFRPHLEASFRKS
ncbi:MAG: phosphonate degradation HD-domain oxygenase [Pseudomonadota bacterium]